MHNEWNTVTYLALQAAEHPSGSAWLGIGGDNLPVLFTNQSRLFVQTHITEAYSTLRRPSRT